MSEGACAMRMVSTGDTQVAYRLTGGGPPLLLIHGAEADHRMFAMLVEYLQLFFTCIAFDQRGCGATNSPLVAFTADDLADDAVAVMAHAGYAAAHVYGTSFGGQVAQSLAVRHPSKVLSLVLGSTWAGGRVLAEVSPEAARDLRWLRADRDANAEKIARYFFPEAFLEANPAAVDRFRSAPAQGEAYRLRAQCIATSVTASAARIAAPTLVITGAQDRLVAAGTTLELVQLIPASLGRVLPGAGHLPCMQMPGALAEEMKFFLDAADRLPRTFL